jgi:rfaE bifunctional protein nucleotidyltransferase chain/domain
MNLTERIKTADEMAAIIGAEKQAGKVVVTTNGVYDFIHAGHVDYLNEARALGDMLVVMVNTDASVKRIKGPARPINAEQDRAAVLASLRCVDYVTFFDEADPSQILDKLKPSLHTKGGDYDPDKMPETKTVRGNGGDVRILALKPGYSNSMQYENIRAATEQESGFERPSWLTNAQKAKH